MNNIFNFKRFGLVIRKDLMENMKRYMLLFLTMIGIMAIVTTTTTWRYCSTWGGGEQYDYMMHNKALLEVLSYAFLAGGLLFASTFMAPMNSKLKRLSYLSNPSSNLEKFLTRWIIVTVGYILAFFAAMWMADALRVAVISARFPGLELKFIDLTKLYSPNGSRYYFFTDEKFTILLFVYFFLQSLFLLGAMCWEKVSFVKTFVAVVTLVFAYVLLCRAAILIAYEEGLKGFGNIFRSFFKYNTGEMMWLVACVAMTVFTLASWVLAFFRFRESEITKRL